MVQKQFHLRHVRHPANIHRTLERERISYVERYWSRVLDNHRDDNYCRHYAIVYLCTTHLVFVLSDGNHIFMGSPQTSAIAQALYRCASSCYLPDEVQTMCPRLSHAAHALRQPRAGDRLSASRLSEMRQMHLGLSNKDYVIRQMK